MLYPQELAVPAKLWIGFSTRVGGVSPKPYSSLNLAVSTGDAAVNVQHNRQIFLAELGIQEGALAQPVQISRSSLQVVTEPGIYPACDALITTTPQVILSILTADCTPILIWSTAPRPVVAAVHSGWQGSQLDILGQTLTHLIEQLQVVPESIYLVIGPGLSQANFEVGPEFSQKFPATYLRRALGGDRFYFDNHGLLTARAIELGVPADQIEILPYCSYQQANLFFSHRRDKGVTGRMMSVIGIKE